MLYLLLLSGCFFVCLAFPSPRDLVRPLRRLYILCICVCMGTKRINGAR